MESNTQKDYTWSDLPQLDKTLCEHIKTEMKFDKVTKVQKAVIPLFLSNKDVCVKACTGSGKTLAFTIPLIQHLMTLQKTKQKFENNEVVGLIFAPARELAFQIHNVVKQFEHLIPDFSINFLTGGTKLEYDVQRIKEKGCNVVIGTIGRIFDLYSKDLISFKKIEVLIMDEADRLLETGNENMLQQLLGALPKQRRTGLFSATMTSQLKSLIRIGMRNPYFVDVRVEMSGIFSTEKDKVSIQQFDLHGDKLVLNKQIQDINEVPQNLENFYTLIDHQADKMRHLLGFLKNLKPVRIIIFFGTCASVDFHNLILRFLINANIYKLHGKIDQKKRSKIYQAFRTQDHEEMESHQLLLTTDLAARGIDIPEVDWIIQYDPPQDSDQYVHRIGRTARAGKSGQSLIFLQKHEEPYVEFLMKKGVKIDLLQINTKEEINEEIKAQVQGEMKQDRDIIDKASSAFVSFVRYYKEHSLQYIFVMNQLDIGEVANSFYLFKVPRVKEILGKSLRTFHQDNSFAVDEVPYKDKNKEKQKEVLIKKRHEKLEYKEQKKAMIEEKQSKQKKDYVPKQEKKRRKQENDWNEWEDLQKEENLIKKLKKGKITLKQFNELIDDGSDFDDL